MRDPKRIRQITNKIALYWETYPDLRLAQVIDIVFRQAKGTNKDDIDNYYVEDARVQVALDEMT